MAANTVRNWYKRYKSESHYKERAYLGKKEKIYKIEFEKYILLNPNLTLVQVGKHFGISIMVVSYYMIKLSYSYKKTFTYMEVKLEVREKYQQVISRYSKKTWYT
ncbi:IS630 transposase-related protein [Orientia tsutsugamushi]|uniref:IS630 transposase-related protein n=1 Tax=Orientia tsutsugamushi TaxID=784 RepID=UPI0009BB22C0|nr:IS630 transposase-related protein [Orientia tsutsugamushi]